MQNYKRYEVFKFVFIWSNQNSSESQIELMSRHDANEVRLELYENSTHPFVVKIWLEETIEEAGKAKWRGHITHIPSGKRSYLNSLGDIEIFIIPYLEVMGIKLGLWWQVKRCFNRWKHSVVRQRRQNLRDTHPIKDSADE